MHDAVGEIAEELFSPIACYLLPAGHDLRQLEQLGHGLPLGDALRAEGDVDVETEAPDDALDQRGDARVDRRAQNEGLAADKVGCKSLHGARDSLRIRVQM